MKNSLHPGEEIVIIKAARPVACEKTRAAARPNAAPRRPK